MGQALYRKYRSRSLSDVVGQEHITTTLNNALKSGKISHAYLFTGPRGVGKTSIARILAHAINELEYNNDNEHLDIIEIDAASNRRIDEIRDLRDKVHIAPTSAKYKVYIIDEVHMLTKEAFNALLKTLEEPPAHVVFILATTESHKLPETIVSRTQRFNFKPIDRSDIVSHLKKIASSEKVKISDDALNIIAEHGEGSARDSISLLDQVRSLHDKEITARDVMEVLGIPPDETIKLLKRYIYDRDAQKSLEVLKNLQDQGFQASQVAKVLSENLRADLFESDNQGEFILKLLKKLLKIPSSANPQKLLELTILEPSFKNIPKNDKPSIKEEVIEARREEAPKPAEKPVQQNNRDTSDDLWNEVLNELKGSQNTLYGMLRMSTPEVSSNKITLVFKYPFHQKRVNQAKYLDGIKKIVNDRTGEDFTIECIVDSHKSEFKASEKSPDDLENISNIFGSAEMLES